MLDTLQELQPDLRSVPITHDLDGIPMVEIAEQQGIPVSTASKWRARALVGFAAEMKRDQQEQEERSDAPGLV